MEAAIDPHSNTVSPTAISPAPQVELSSSQSREREDAQPTRPMLDPVGEGVAQTAANAGEAGSDSTPNSAMLMITRGPERGSCLRLTSDRATIGRYRSCDISLDHVTVSRHHADIRYDGERYTLVDNGSLNGTYHNRRPVGFAELADGDEVRIGVFRLTFHTAPPVG